MLLLAFIAVLLIAVAVGLFTFAILEPRARRSENLDQIVAYGYAASQRAPSPRAQKQARLSLDKLAARVGDLLVGKVLNVRESEIQLELISAGFFRVGVRRFLGYRLLLAVALPVVMIWFLGVSGAPVIDVVLAAAVAAVIGWTAPSFIVHRRSRMRLTEVDDSLPELIDLLVVTLEAGVSFTGALRLASERLEGPLGEEIRLTIQEQTLGLSTLEALENWQRRCETPGVHSFVRAMVQGDRLGVSIGSILRNQAVEMRARHRFTVEERAQKAPIKILFPLVFLIFPAMFVIILGPALLTISTSLKG